MLQGRLQYLYFIQLVIEPQIRISSYKYLPLKIQFKKQLFPKFWLSLVSVPKGSQNAATFCNNIYETSFSVFTNMVTK